MTTQEIHVSDCILDKIIGKLYGLLDSITCDTLYLDTMDDDATCDCLPKMLPSRVRLCITSKGLTLDNHDGGESKLRNIVNRITFIFYSKSTPVLPFLSKDDLLVNDNLRDLESA